MGRNGRDEGFERRRGRWCCGLVRDGERRRSCRCCSTVVHGAGGRAGSAHPRQCPAWRVRGLRVIGKGRRMVVGRKGGATSPPKPISGMEMLAFIRRQRRGGGRVRFVAEQKGPVPGSEVQEPEKKVTNSEKESDGAVEVGWKGGASPPKPILGSKNSCLEKPNNSSSEDGSGGMVVVGRNGGGERAHPSRYLARRGHNRKRNKATGSDGKPTGMLG